MPEPQPIPAAVERAARVDRIVAGHEDLMHRLAGTHAPEFLEIGVTMPQAKVLYLVIASGEIRMSELSARLGVSLSTVSGLVDRLVDHGLAARHDDPADRRQVVISATPAGHELLERFRELNAAQLRAMLDSLGDDDLVVVERGIELLASTLPAAGLPSPLPTQTTQNEVNP